jgi:hypothetical protein
MNKRRSLSGIYIFEKFQDEESRKPTCIEDCLKETRQKWLESLEKEALINCIHHLCNTLCEISDQFDIVGN